MHIRAMSTTQDKNNDAAQPDTDSNQEDVEQTEEEEEFEEPNDAQHLEAANEQIAELQSKIEDLQAELKKYQDALARSHADIINIQNMSKKDVESARKFAIKGFSKDLLNVADALEGCIKVVDQHLNEYKNDQNELDENVQSVIQGVKLTHGTLLDTFGRHGINKIESLHQEFDPNFHEALFKQPTHEHPEDVVVSVISEGYTIKDAVLRAAKVGVSTPAPQAQTSNEEEAQQDGGESEQK
eukprot:CAMPEP_0197075464 /NCGR_PEP_ID=MMETSP1384-20130603/211619_1 /TAXON_ID=29189 /ORGANISM="Ammonia sp." /LENGTH=240 /DNA_ID=CAMNT_0042514311 /DNA_START=1537 /DNA_END=2259 /DNA_ORIENTATION=+